MAVSEEEEFEFRRRADAERRAKTAKKPSATMDVIKSTATGLGKAVTGLISAPGDLADLQGNVAEWGVKKIGRALGAFTPEQIAAQDKAGGYSDEYSRSNGLITSAKLNKGVGLTYKPQTTAGKYAETTASFAGNAIAPGGLVRKSLAVVVPAVASESAGQAAEAAGLGTKGQAAARVAGALVGGVTAASRLRPRPQLDEAAGMAEATAALEGAGVNVSVVSEASMGRIRDLVRRGRSPREAALSVVATDDLPIPVPLTKGQRTGEPGQQLSENLMLRGAKGSGAARRMRGVVQDQQTALRANTDAIADQVAGGRAPERGVGPALASERLNAMYDEGRSGVNRAYDAARASTGDAALPVAERATASSRLKEAVGDFDEIDVAPVFRVIDQVGDKKAMTARKLFDARSRLVALQTGGDRTAVAAGRAKGALDNYINEALDRDLFSGDTEAVALWRTAISQRREFGKRFESGDLIEKLTARVGPAREMRVDPGDAANYILGRSDMGFVGKQNLYRGLDRLRDVLGADSAEWNGIRAEMFRRLASKGEGAMEGAFGRQFSGANFQKAWQDFRAKDPRLASSIFTEAERNLIDKFAAVASRATSPVRGGDNPSNTATAAMRLLGNLGFLRGLPFVKEMTTAIEVQANTGAARAAASQTVGAAAKPRAPRGPLITPEQRTGGLIAGTTGAVSGLGLLSQQ